MQTLYFRRLFRFSFRLWIISLCLACSFFLPETNRQEGRQALANSRSQPGEAPPTEKDKKHFLDTARELIRASGIIRSFSATIPKFEDQIYRNVTQTRPELAQDLKEVLEILKPRFLLQLDEIVTEAAEIYTKFMTQEELNILVAFFHSPVGKKYVSTQPVLLDQILSAVHEWSQKISSDMFTAVRTEMRKKGHDF